MKKNIRQLTKLFRSWSLYLALGGLALPGSLAAWEQVDQKIDIQMKIPVELLPQFQQWGQNLFQPPSYNWQKKPKAGVYYPYKKVPETYPAEWSYQYPSYLSDKYFNYYKLKKEQPAKKKKKKPAPSPKAGEKFHKKNQEISFQKLGAVLFPVGSSTLTPKARHRLSKIAMEMKLDRFSYINIKGFTDITGGNKMNHRLGLKRARAVAEFLEALGVNMERAYIGSGGESMAHGSAYKPNRRAEIYGFYSPLPRKTSFSYDAQQMAYDKTGPNYFLFFLVGFLFLAIVGSVVFIIVTN